MRDRVERILTTRSREFQPHSPGGAQDYGPGPKRNQNGDAPPR